MEEPYSQRRPKHQDKHYKGTAFNLIFYGL